ncbi:MAG TPA: hypothetical protein VGK67_39870 [Myxococcales bacterium]
MTVKITGNKVPTSGAKASGELSRSEQDSILRLVNAEKKTQKGGPPMTVKYMVHPPKPGGGGKPPVAAKYMVVRPPIDEKPPVAAKYMVVRPPVDNGGGKPPIAAKYMVVPGPIVAKYMVVPPWANVDAHQAVINKATKNGVVSIAEATTMAKLFNRDIAHADKEGRNIRPDVAKFLKAALSDVKLGEKANEILFGETGPGYVAKKPQPCYIMAPRKNDQKDQPIYILPPTSKPDTQTHPIYILPPTTKGKK